MHFIVHMAAYDSLFPKRMIKQLFLLVTNKKAVLTEPPLDCVKGCIKLLLCFVISCLTGAESRLVHTVVDLHITDVPSRRT